MAAAVARTTPLYAFCQSTRRWTSLADLQDTSSAFMSQDQASATSASAGVAQSIASTSRIETLPSSLTCITYNVFSGPSSSSVPHLSHRIKGALRILQQSGADVIALQEVSSTFERALRQERWFRGNFVLTGLRDYFLASTSGKRADQSARGEDDGCLLATRKTLVDVQSQASMSRLSGEQGKVLVSISSAAGVCCRTRLPKACALTS